jgi:hypothetical protein
MRVGGELRVAVVQASTGTVTVTRAGTCAAPCVERPAGLAIGPQVLVVADTQPDTTIALTALG